MNTHDAAVSGPAADPTAVAAPAGQGARPRVLLLFGGRSGEHEISCVTAAGVMQAIDPERYDVVPIGITRGGQWVAVSADPAAWQITDGTLPAVEDADQTVVLSLEVGQRSLSTTQPDAAPGHLGQIDVVFPLLHGPYGEDGTIQGMLDLAGIPYVGAGVLASAVAMDKHYMKIVLEGHGLPVSPYVVVRPGQWPAQAESITAQARELGLPLFVKPARAGSSLGISKVTDLAQLPAAMAAAQEHDPKVLIEAGMSGREIECAVLGPRRVGEAPRTAIPGEIVVGDSNHGFYDYEAKYLGAGDVQLSCPTDLPESVQAEVQDIARQAFEALGCEGLARVDTFVSADGVITINEVNTMPGFTPFSMYPVMWQRSGMSYAELVDELLQMALARSTGLR